MEKEKPKIFQNRYEKIVQIGKGSFGTVYLIWDKKGNIKSLKELLDNKEEINLLAIKKSINNENFKTQGIDFTFLREIKIMKEINHLNIINLKDVFFDEESFCTLMDYMVYDLKNLIANHFDYITIKDIKCILHQIITGLNFLHKSWIFHRDVSPANMFLNNEGVLKISDLGFAKYFGSPDRLLTKGAVTLFYRPPELLFGSNNYGPKIDMWSVGCIMAELFFGQPIFPGQVEIDQLSKIFQVLGTPNENNWPDCVKLDGYLKFEPQKGVSLKEILYDIPDDALDLLYKLLTLDPNKRIDAETALKHDFFKNSPKIQDCTYMKLYNQIKENEIKGMLKAHIEKFYN